MNVYVYRAALLCESCAQARMATLAKPAGFDPSNESSWDSGDYPKGPYSNGGGESDSPSHCDDCGEFLENPLTDDGERYLADVLDSGEGDSAVLARWRDFYGLDGPS